MSRVQLALNVAELDSAIDFYTQMFKTEPHKVRPGYANFEVAGPAPQAGADRERVGGRAAQPSRRRGWNHHRSPRRDPALRRTRPRHGDRGPGGLLPRRAGQGLGLRPLRHPLGGLHDHRRPARSILRIPRRQPDPAHRGHRRLQAIEDCCADGGLCVG